MAALNPLKHIFGPAWFAVFFLRRWSIPTLVTNVGYIARLHGPFFKRMKWEDVVTIEGVQWDRMAYDELFLLLKDGKGRRLVIGELDDGFKDFWSILDVKCPGFPSDWKTAVYNSGFGSPQVLWQKC